MRAPSTSGLSVELLLRVIDVKMVTLLYFYFNMTLHVMNVSLLSSWDRPELYLSQSLSRQCIISNHPFIKCSCIMC